MAMGERATRAAHFPSISPFESLRTGSGRTDEACGGLGVGWFLDWLSASVS